jgi:hypothetical protein
VVKNDDNWKSFKKMCHDIMIDRQKKTINIDVASQLKRQRIEDEYMMTTAELAYLVDAV